MKPKVIFIVGPTASGKSALGIYLAERLSGEIISADSRQVYRGLDIGTGKVTHDEMKGVPHHMLDVVDPSQTFTASDYQRMSTECVRAIVARKKHPFVVGGTGFYIDVLRGHIVLPSVPPNLPFRRRLQDMDTGMLFSLLYKKDAERARIVGTSNKRRLVRSLEVVSVMGRMPRFVPAQLYRELFIGLCPPDLEERIERRLKWRLQNGMLEEAYRLHQRGLTWERMDALGLEYRFLANYFRGKLSREELEEKLFRAILRYAKKQMTYFKRNQSIQWFLSEEKDKREILLLCKKFLSG